MLLKPCPFCAFTPNSDDPDCIYLINREHQIYNLVCYEPQGCGASVLGDSRQDVIQRWNTRIKCESLLEDEDLIEQARRFF